MRARQPGTATIVRVSLTQSRGTAPRPCRSTATGSAPGARCSAPPARGNRKGGSRHADRPHPPRQPVLRDHGQVAPSVAAGAPVVRLERCRRSAPGRWPERRSSARGRARTVARSGRRLARAPAANRARGSARSGEWRDRPARRPRAAGRPRRRPAGPPAPALPARPVPCFPRRARLGCRAASEERWIRRRPGWDAAASATRSVPPALTARNAARLGAGSRRRGARPPRAAHRSAGRSRSPTNRGPRWLGGGQRGVVAAGKARTRGRPRAGPRPCAARRSRWRRSPRRWTSRWTRRRRRIPAARQLATGRLKLRPRPLPAARNVADGAAEIVRLDGGPAELAGVVKVSERVGARTTSHSTPATRRTTAATAERS